MAERAKKGARLPGALGVDEHGALHLPAVPRGIEVSEDTAERVADEDVGGTRVATRQKRRQVAEVGVHAALTAQTVVAAGPRGARECRLDVRPRRVCRVKPCFKHDRGRAGADAVHARLRRVTTATAARTAENCRGAERRRSDQASVLRRCARNSSRSERVRTPIGLPLSATTTGFVRPLSVEKT